MWFVALPSFFVWCFGVTGRVPAPRPTLKTKRLYTPSPRPAQGIVEGNETESSGGAVLPCERTNPESRTNPERIEGRREHPGLRNDAVRPPASASSSSGGGASGRPSYNVDLCKVGVPVVTPAETTAPACSPTPVRGMQFQFFVPHCLPPRSGCFSLRSYLHLWRFAGRSRGWTHFVPNNTVRSLPIVCGF